MARSNFGQQHGDYSLDLISLTAVDGKRKHDHSNVGWFAALLSWFSLWFQRLTGGEGAVLKRRGQVRLADEEAD